MSTKYYSTRKKQNDQVPIYLGNRVVGMVKGDTFQKTLTGSRHFLRVPPAIAFDVSTLENAQRVGATWVEVKDRETGTKYRAKIAHVFEKGFELDRNFGKQQALTLDGWIKSGQAVQMGLWG